MLACKVHSIQRENIPSHGHSKTLKNAAVQRSCPVWKVMDTLVEVLGLHLRIANAEMNVSEEEMTRDMICNKNQAFDAHNLADMCSKACNFCIIMPKGSVKLR